jgi:DNA-binding response OmpR family regulator
MVQDRNESEAATVLVVDDEEDIVTYLVTLLQDCGYQALGACDAAAALEAIDVVAPNLILLDIMMPGQSGLSLFQKLRGSVKTADVPVLFISGCHQIEELSTLEESGNVKIAEAACYFEKPIRAEELMRRIRELLPQTREVVL